jgi:hypothetical protein
MGDIFEGLNYTGIFFNTGRYYDKHGQRITAVKLQGYPDTVLFVDHSRMVSGVIRNFNHDLDPYTVMAAYDHGLYGSGYDHPDYEQIKQLQRYIEEKYRKNPEWFTFRDYKI